ncbi:TPA: hypothetical protein RPW15_001475 [Campylobacter fetus subsp. venerealis]|nr:hypothetical protein [Campylobacter fetus subsp. venerealis]HDX6253956.1 hypothetical protein [Campylobacter fetus subsp. venerealis]HDX6258144.1 hypothetical protein [Campylobacter fetus subsp. venerealis]HDX6261803.1 hypothetical protein [Campylobacter fetus subsp. venerealis]HDX6263933.1 hypothetical protein [Campylobacter fetus subsp. venerealis]
MKKTILILALISGICFANTTEENNIIESSAYGQKVVKEQGSSNFGEYGQREYFRKEAIFNYILWNSKQNSPEYITKKASLINFIEENRDANITNTVAKVDSNITVSGYCLIRDNIMIGKQPGAGRFICNTNIGQIEIFGNLTPINDALTLIYDPAYIEYKNWRYRVVTSRVLNEARTSYNIATYANDRKLSEIALSATSNTADVIKTQSSDYLKQLEQSRKNQKTEYVTVGSGSGSYVAPVQNENTEKPNAVDYIAKAGIDIVSGVVKNTAEIFKRDLPYLYEIVGGSRVYVDLVIDRNGEKIK